MSATPSQAATNHNQLAADLPVRLYTAMRTMRLYPPTNPQVLRNITTAYQAYKALAEGNTGDNVVIALSEQKIIVNDEHLTEKDHALPQIKGLIEFFDKLQLHSISFDSTFNEDDCRTFINLLAEIFAQKEVKQPLAELLSEANLTTVRVDAKRYVIVGEGEQVVREDEIGFGSGVNISEDEMANYILGHTGVGLSLTANLPPHLGPLLEVFTEALQEHDNPEQLTSAFLNALSGGNGERSEGQGNEQRANDISTAVDTLAKISSDQLSQLIGLLPKTSSSNALLDATIENMDSGQLNSLVNSLISQLTENAAGTEETQQDTSPGETIKRLINSSKGAEVKKAIALNTDARQMLDNPNTTLAELPDHLLQRLQQPEWSAPVLANAVQQAADPQGSSVPVDPQALNKMLQNYEQILNPEQQQQVAAQAGAQLASSEALALGNVLAQKFKGLFGETLYHQVINQVSDELLDETIEHLNPKQLNRMVAMLTSSIPLAIDNNGNPDFTAIDDDALAKLINSSKGAEVKKAIALNTDARQMLDNPNTTLAELPDHLLQRLQQPEWSAPVLANAVQQAADPQGSTAPVDPQALNTMLQNYEQILSPEQQQQVAAQAGAQLASSEALALGNVLAQKFKGLFGETLYHQVINQVSDELLDETIEHLNPKQLNRMVAMLTSSIPLAIDKKDAEQLSIDESLLNRLKNTSKGHIIEQSIAQHLDAQQLHNASAEHQLPAQLKTRLQQPAWSAPILVSTAQLAVDPEVSGKEPDFDHFDKVISGYQSLLPADKQDKIATQAGAQIASFEDKELGTLLIQRFKGLFGDKLYTEIVKHLTDDKLATLTQQLYRYSTGQEILPSGESNETVSAAYKQLMQTVKNIKMRTVVEMHKDRQRQQEETRLDTIEKGIQSILSNDPKAFTNKLVSQALPETVAQYLTEGKERQADTLLMHTAVALQSDSITIQRNSAVALAEITQQLAQQRQWERLIRLMPALEQALKHLGKDEESVKKIITALSKLAHYYLQQENYEKAYEVIHAIGRITSGQNAHFSETVHKHSTKALEHISSDDILKKLLEVYLHDEKKRDNAGNLLTDLGRKSAHFQLQYLMKSESRFERKLLINLISQTGHTASDVLLDQLIQPSPWYVTRNIVRLLGEIGSPSFIRPISQFFDHKDLRVQQEVLNTAVKIGGEHIHQFLLQAFNEMHDGIKTRVVHYMAQYPSETYVRPLLDVLEANRPLQGKNKIQFQLAICKTLGIIGDRRALQLLQTVAQSKSVLGISGYNDEVRNAAARTIRLIRSHAQEGRVPQTKKEVTATQQSPLSTPAQNIPSIAEKEQHIFHMAEQDKKEQAKEALFELVVATAKAGDYDNAERLRERIYEIDPMALSEIIRSGEIIEQEKSGAINEEDLTIWAQLTDVLTTEEFQTLYHGLIEKTYTPEESIVTQGAKNDELYFINQGSIKVSHQVQEKEIFITSLNRGEIIGENFFTPSIWTISLTALTQSRISVLKQETLVKWKNQFPGLENKLNSFYEKTNQITSILQKKGLERRKDDRFTISRKIQVQPTDYNGNAIGRGFRAEIIDISRGGLAFVIRITKKENTKLLLGRNLQIVLPIGGKANYLYLPGQSIGVQPFNVFESDYAVHFTFHTQLEQKVLQQILG